MIKKGEKFIMVDCFCGVNPTRDNIASKMKEHLKKGDIYTISGFYEIDPVSGESTGKLKEWIVNEDFTLS